MLLHHNVTQDSSWLKECVSHVQPMLLHVPLDQSQPLVTLDISFQQELVLLVDQELQPVPAQLLL